MASANLFKISILIYSLFLILVFSAGVSAEIIIDRCGFVIEEEGSYILPFDLKCSGDEDFIEGEDPAITIRSSNVIIDCQSKDLRGAYSEGARSIDGIVVDDDGFENIFIRNCFIFDFRNAIYLQNTQNSIVESNSIELSRTGIYLEDSNDNAIRFNTLSDSVSYLQAASRDGAGLKLEDSSGNIIMDNLIDENEVYGVYIKSGEGNILRGNTVTNNDNRRNLLEKAGIKILESNQNIIERNSIRNNGDGNSNGGILISGGNENIIRSNVITENSYNGIIIMPSNWGNRVSSGNVIENNEISQNRFYGISLTGNENMISQNTLSGNGYAGIHLAGAERNNISENIMSTPVRNLQLKGISFWRSYENQVFLNDIQNSSIGGIYLYYSTSNELSGNKVNKNLRGFHLEHSGDNIFSENEICQNENFDVFTDENIEGEFSNNICNTIEGADVECFTLCPERYEQIIDLRSGWNFISSYVIPRNDSMQDIFSGIEENVEIVKDENGKFYSPQNNFDNLGIWNPNKAYLVKMSDDAVLVIKGDEYIGTAFRLSTGKWNFIAYPLDESYTMYGENGIIEEVINPSIGYYAQMTIKDGYGGLFKSNQKESLSTIPEMRPGKGYMIMVDRAVNLDFGRLL